MAMLNNQRVNKKSFTDTGSTGAARPGWSGKAQKVLISRSIVPGNVRQDHVVPSGNLT